MATDCSVWVGPGDSRRRGSGSARRRRRTRARRRSPAVIAHLKPDLGAPDGGVDLGARADDARIVQQALDVVFAVTGDDLGIEAVEGVADALAFSEDGDPGKASLEAVKHQLFPQGAGIALRPPHSVS
jgi:hypothetical protein